MTIDAWADQSIVLPRSVAAEPGPIRLDRTPYLREILRAATDPDVEEITLMFSTQVGKTTACQLVVLYYLAEDPWPCLHVAPREDDAIAINVDRYQRIILESPLLARCLVGATNDMTREAIRLNGAALTFVGANSPAALSSRPIAILVLDETDKYPARSGKEADPIALARERTRTFDNRKIIKVSTPTTDAGYIHQQFKAGDQRRYHVPCPLCGIYQELVMGTALQGGSGILWPEGERDPERILDSHMAWYQCGHCHGRIEDMHKPEMLRRGIWVPAAGRVDPGGVLVVSRQPRRLLSYHLSALYSPWLTWSRIAAEFLRSKDYPGLLMNFRNSWLADVWEDRIEELRTDHLRARIGPWEYGVVPREARAITGGVDVQIDHLWYVLRAWGARGESWLIRCGRCEGPEQLAAIMKAPYVVEGGQDRVPLVMAFIDSGWGMRQDEIYQWCRWIPGLNPVKGAARPLRSYTTSSFTHSDGTQGKLSMIDTTHYKNMLHRMIRVHDGDPDAWHLPRGVEEAYYAHMVAEQRVQEQDKLTGRPYMRWKLIPQGAANHLFDCEVYALVGADVLNLRERFTAEGGLAAAVPGQAVEQEKPRRFYRMTSNIFRS